jgi:arginyl-tRNA synthetase
MNSFVQALAARIATASGIAEADAAKLVETPKDPKLGDYSFPCFTLAKSLKKAPPLIAKDLAAAVLAAPGTAGFFSTVEAAGPYVNVRLAPGALARSVIDAARSGGARFGHSDEGGGRAVPIDYSSPNIAKRFHAGHLRSTVIGGALYRIYAALGYRPVGINHLGDWGTQFGHLMSAWTKWGGDEARIAADPIGYLQELYVRHNKEAKADPSYEQEARAWFKRLEDGDAEARALWQRFRDLSLADFQKTWDLLGTRHDAVAGESFYESMMPEAIRLMVERGIAEESQGALIVDFKKHGVDIAEPMLVRRSDGATLYATRDVAAAIYRFRTYDPARVLYVIGQEQRLAMRQLFATLTLLGFPGDRCVHVDFGRILGMSSREGTAILLDEILGRAVELARAEVVARTPDVPEEELSRVARQVGVGAVIFADLKNRRVLDFEFDWDRFVKFEGDTGPYVMYTHARLFQLLRKLAEEGVDAGGAYDGALLAEPEALAVLRAVEGFPRKVEQAAREHEPSVIAKHLLETAGAVNGFYQKHRVKDAPTPELRAARAALVGAALTAIRNGLALLGVEAPERM